MVASYSYDAWGNHTVYDEYGDVNTYYGTIGNINPIRYRSYYYDTETGLYYLQSRYYDPQTGRFISADKTEYLGENNDLMSYNLYVYCSNNPIMFVDPTGMFNWGKLITSVVVGVAVGILIGASTSNVALGIVGGAAAFTVVSNIYSVVESNIIVRNDDTLAIDKDEYKNYQENNIPTYTFNTNSEKLSYIRAAKKFESEKYSGWSEAQMLREFTYHNQAYSLFNGIESFFPNPVTKGLRKRAEHVDFEEKQNFETYFRRYLGNCCFW